MVLGYARLKYHCGSRLPLPPYLLLVDLNINLSVHALLERDESLGLGYTGYMLDAVVEQLHEVKVILGEYLDEHRVGAGGEVTFHYFGNLLELLHDLTIEGTLLKLHTHISASIVSDTLWVNVIAGPYYHLHIDKTLYALMNRRAGHSTFEGDILGGDARVAHDDIEYLLV